jgi:hypothetical protein
MKYGVRTTKGVDCREMGCPEAGGYKSLVMKLMKKAGMKQYKRKWEFMDTKRSWR